MSGADDATVITRFDQLRLLDRETASRELPVRVRGVITYADASWNLLFVQDETQGFAVPTSDIPEALKPGDEVELQGVTASSEQGPTVARPQVKALGKRSLPKPLLPGEADLWSGQFAAQWVEIAGVVRVVEVLDERLKLEFVKGNTRLLGFVRRAPEKAGEASRLVGARVKVRGVLTCRYEGGRVAGVGLLIPAMNQVEIVTPSRPMAQYPVVTIQEVLAERRTGEPAQRVRIRGVVVGKQGASSMRLSSLVLRDDTGTITETTPTRNPINVDDRVDLWAFPAVAERDVYLEDAEHAPVPGTESRSTESVTAAGSNEAEVLRTAQEVRALNKAQAGKRLPVRLRGVVTYADPAWPHFFLQDQTGALFIRDWKGKVQSGDWVEIEGVTDAGGIARMVVDATGRVMGTTNLPEPFHVDLTALLAEAYDCAWVQLEGVVRSVVDQPGHTVLRLVNEQGRFEAVLPAVDGGASLHYLANARVSLRGVSTGVLNSRDQWVSIQLRVPNADAVQVLEAAPADAFEIELRPISAVNREALALLGLRRVRVRGEVTLQGPGDDFSLQDASGAIRVNPARPEAVRAGEVLDVVGYPAVDGLANHLEEALFRRSGEVLAIQPRVVDAAAILPQGRYDRELIVLEGRLLNDAGGSALPSLIVQSGLVVFPVQFATGGPGARFPLWRAGSLLRLTGICNVQADERNEPRSFALLLRSVADVQVLHQPSWWTPRHTGLVGGALLCAVGAVLGWVYLLRRQVREKTDQIQSRIESEAALAKRLALVWETSAEGMRLADAAGLTTKVNEAYCRMVGKPREELEGQPLTITYQEDQRTSMLNRYRQRFESRTIPQHVEEELVLWNGQKVWFEATNAMLEQAGFPTLVLSQFRDVTQRKRAEVERDRLQSQLLQAQKMESVGRLAGGVAHDFNNMLQVILGNLDISLSQVGPDDPLRGDLEEARRAARRSADLTRQLLAFARRQTMMPKVLDLNDTVASMLKMLQRLIGEDIQLTWIPGRDLWPVKMDPAQLDQILANLTVNARDAIGGVGKVAIETGNFTLDAAAVASTPDGVPGDYVMLAVSDNGHGMTQEVQAHLFEPFFTTKEQGKGTGLGLATVYGIVKQNGGLINVASERDKGTTIKIHLPRCLAEAEAAAEPGRTSMQRGSETVLLVEDEPQILNLGQRFLRRQGYTVLAAHSPDEALHLARNHTEPIHLLVTDVVMPGMNGLELKHQVERFKPGVQCLFMSGYTADVISRHGVLEEGVQFLQKPFNTEALAAKVRELLDGGKT